jgi:hypothetical protein
MDAATGSHLLPTSPPLGPYLTAHPDLSAILFDVSVSCCLPLSLALLSSAMS